MQNLIKACPLSPQEAMAKTSQRPFFVEKVTTGHIVISHNLTKDNSTYRMLVLLYGIAFFLFIYFFSITDQISFCSASEKPKAI